MATQIYFNEQCGKFKLRYLRDLAVLLSSALTLVCPEEMASVAILHMS